MSSLASASTPETGSLTASNPNFSMTLQELRAKIDVIDTELLRLLNERTQLVLEVGKIMVDLCHFN